MARDTVRDRGAMIYAYLTTRLHRPVRMADLAQRFRIVNGDTTRRAVREAAALARADGLCLRVPCPANGFTLMLTDRAEALLAEAAWLGKVRRGVTNRETMHAEVIAANLAGLDPALRRDAERYVQLQELVARTNALAATTVDDLAETVKARRAAAAPTP
jgi:hypothetical protein